jgi:hypothetical protein
MRILVTAASIAEYGLDKITGNSKEELMIRVEQMKANGYDMFVNLPDVQGGDTEAPNERNVFEHFGDELPEPDGAAHSQEAVNLTNAGFIHNTCSYRQVALPGPTFNSKWICVIHDVPSKHDVEASPHAPCISVDPLGNHIWE